MSRSDRIAMEEVARDLETDGGCDLGRVDSGIGSVGSGGVQATSLCFFFCFF